MSSSSRGRGSTGFSVRDFGWCTVRNGVRDEGLIRKGGFRRTKARPTEVRSVVGALHFPYRRALRQGASRGVREWIRDCEFLNLVSQRYGSIRYVAVQNIVI